jgi:hypothetical protein
LVAARQAQHLAAKAKLKPAQIRKVKPSISISIAAAPELSQFSANTERNRRYEASVGNRG